jgi:hypothetical protein
MNTVKVILPISYDEHLGEDMLKHTLIAALIESLAINDLRIYSDVLDNMSYSLDEDSLAYGVDDYMGFLSDTILDKTQPLLEVTIPPKVFDMLSTNGYAVTDIENHYGNTCIVLEMPIPGDDD